MPNAISSAPSLLRPTTTKSPYEEMTTEEYRAALNKLGL
jgi:hypothetical protein